MSEIQNQNLEGEGEPSTSTSVNVPQYIDIICDYCDRIHRKFPASPPKKLLIYERDGWDDIYVPPLVAVEILDDGEEGYGADLWMDDLFTKKQIREFHTKYNDEVVIDDEDVERALHRLWKAKYKRTEQKHALGEIWERVE